MSEMAARGGRGQEVPRCGNTQVLSLQGKCTTYARVGMGMYALLYGGLNETGLPGSARFVVKADAVASIVNCARLHRQRERSWVVTSSSHRQSTPRFSRTGIGGYRERVVGPGSLPHLRSTTRLDGPSNGSFLRRYGGADVFRV